jgi:hypothetical protein
MPILRRWLGRPGPDISIAQLKIDRFWDPIRNGSGFQALLTIKKHVRP